MARERKLPLRNQRQRKSAERYNSSLSALPRLQLCRNSSLVLPVGLIQAGSRISIPAKLPQKNFLSHYATQLNTVEVNFTFRQLVKETTIQKWINETPAGFRFGIKAHQVITHIKRLKNTADFLPRFLATIEPLASARKLGPVLFQLPPNLKADAAVLEEFLAILPRAVPSALEFRHDSWFS